MTTQGLLCATGVAFWSWGFGRSSAICLLTIVHAVFWCVSCRSWSDGKQIPVTQCKNLCTCSDTPESWLKTATFITDIRIINYIYVGRSKPQNMDVDMGKKLKYLCILRCFSEIIIFTGITYKVQVDLSFSKSRVTQWHVSCSCFMLHTFSGGRNPQTLP